MIRAATYRVERRAWNPLASLAATFVLATLAVAALGGILDPTSGQDVADWWPGSLFLVATTALLLRGWWVGVTRRGDHLVVRGWLRTLRVEVAQVRRVKIVPYSGNWNLGSESRMFQMLQLELYDGRVDLEILARRPRTVSRLAEQVRQMADVGEKPTA